MSSEDFPKAQDSTGNDQPAVAPSAPYAGEHYTDHENTGPLTVAASSPPADPAGSHPGNEGPDGASSSESTPSHGSEVVQPTSHGNDVSPYPAAPVWQPRPSGALSAEAWSSPSSTASYPTGPAASSYGTGQYRAEGQYPGYGQPTGATPPIYPTFVPGTSGYGTGSVPPVGPGNSGTATATKPGRSRRTVLVAAATVVLALGAGFGGGVLGANTGNNASNDTSISQQSTSPVVSDTQAVTAGTASVESVAAKLLPSVVSILSISSTEEGEGSGIILSADGLILTNNHVIAGATDLTVRFNDGTTAAATVIGSDATDDLAVIKVSNVSGLTKATLGKSSDVKVGEQVVAVGSPLGLSATVTSGIISALNRPVRTSSSESQSQQGQSTTTSQDTVLNAIQTDAAINPGNSGGALVDMSGAVIGINSAIASLSSSSSSTQSGSIGVGFAIPIDQASRIAQEIINTGHATHAVLGASVGDAPDGTTSNAAAAAQAGLSVGAKVASVTSGGGAAAAGLKAGDVITKIGGTAVDSADALIATIRSQTPGSAVTVTYTRDSKMATTSVTLGSAVSN